MGWPVARTCDSAWHVVGASFVMKDHLKGAWILKFYLIFTSGRLGGTAAVITTSLGS